MFKKLLENKNQGIFTKKHLKDADKGTETPQTLKNPEKKEVSQINEHVISSISMGLLAFKK